MSTSSPSIGFQSGRSVERGRLENRSTTVMMASWPLVVGGNPETQSMDTLCHLVSGTGNGLGTLAVSTCLGFAA